MPRQTILAYRKGKSVPGLVAAGKIASAFGMSLGEFIGDTPADHPITECSHRVHEAIVGGAERREGRDGDLLELAFRLLEAFRERHPELSAEIGEMRQAFQDARGRRGMPGGG